MDNNRTCEVCGTDFKCWPNQAREGTGYYCSKACHGKAMSAERAGGGNPAWKGDKVKYGSLHVWLRRNYEKPDACQHCGEEKRLDWAKIADREYSRDIGDYMALCRKCHVRYDKEHAAG